MGNELKCIRPSYERAPRLPHNRFKVRNVNDQGRVVNKGYLEVTRTELILYVLNAEPVRWPLRCLRRYGYDANLFSFESGRRCSTGPGIYAFKSKYASQIFQLVQENAQRPEEGASGTAPAEVNGAATLPLTSAIHQGSLGDETSLPLSQVVSRSSSHNSGMNGTLSAHPGVLPTVSHVPLVPTSASPVYFNGNGNGSLGSCSLRLSPVSPNMQYVNTMGFSEIPETPQENSTSQVRLSNGSAPQATATFDRNDSFGDPSLNYARLKLPADEDRCNVDQEEKSRLGMAEETDGVGERGKEDCSRRDSEDRNNESVDSGKVEDLVEQSKCAANAVCDERNSASEETLDSRDDQGMETSNTDSVKALVGEQVASEDSSEESVVTTGKSSGEEDSPRKIVEDSVEPLIDFSETSLVEGASERKGSLPRERKQKKSKVSDVDRTALFQDFVNGNIRPDKLKDRSGGIMVNYANWPEQQLQEVLQKLETGRNDNISPCTVCSNSSGNASQRVSPLSYYANLDTAGELPPNWQANGFQFYQDLRTPRSAASSKGSTGSEFTFDVNRGSCSPVDHNYANLDTLPEAQQPPMRHGSVPGTGGGAWMILQQPPKGKMNYIELEFDENDQPILHTHPHGVTLPTRRSISCSASSTPPKTPVSPQQEMVPTAARATDIYARIDIEKTVALANSHRHVDGDTDTSTRRTRHDVWTGNSGH